MYVTVSMVKINFRTVLCFCADDVPGYVRYPDSDCRGNDFVGVRNVTFPSECGALCEQTEGCIGFVYDARNSINNCFLKNICDDLTELIQVHTYKKLTETGMWTCSTDKNLQF